MKGLGHLNLEEVFYLFFSNYPISTSEYLEIKVEGVSFVESDSNLYSLI